MRVIGGSVQRFESPRGAFFGRCYWRVPQRGDPEEDPGHAVVTMSLGWPGNTLGSSLRSLSVLGSCSRMREGWNVRLIGGSVQRFESPQDAFLGRCYWHVPQRGDPEEDPGHAGVTMLLGWPWNALGSSQRKCPGRGKSGCSCSGTCPRDQAPDNTCIFQFFKIYFFLG